MSGDSSVLRPVSDPFGTDGGLKLLQGNLGRAVIKTSAVQSQHRVVEAPAAVFDDQEDVMKAFKTGALNRDCIVVVRYQGPKANGMPELHQLTPALTSLQSKGFKVALVTDGRMSGASGAVPAAIHLTPECLSGGPLVKVQNGDILTLDSYTGTLQVHVPEDVLASRVVPAPELSRNGFGMGRELFASFRAAAGDAELGAMASM
jgi:phosphogluconate dehydratase